MRGHLLPVLRTYNPAIDEAVTRMARTFRDEDAWLDSETTKRWQRIARPVDSGTGLDLTGWGRQPLAIRRRLVRKIAEACQYDEIGFDAVERALAVAAADGPPRADLGGGLAVERRGGLLVFARRLRGE